MRKTAPITWTTHLLMLWCRCSALLWRKYRKQSTKRAGYAIAPHPSPTTYPSAVALKGAEWPTRDNLRNQSVAVKWEGFGSPKCPTFFFPTDILHSLYQLDDLVFTMISRDKGLPRHRLIAQRPWNIRGLSRWFTPGEVFWSVGSKNSAYTSFMSGNHLPLWPTMVNHSFLWTAWGAINVKCIYIYIYLLFFIF